MSPGKGNDDDTQRSRHSSSPTDSAFKHEKLSEHENLPESLQRIVDQADEDDNIYGDFWAPE